jgi:hypothetical protein
MGRITGAEFRNLSCPADRRGAILYNDLALFDIVSSEPRRACSWPERPVRSRRPDADRIENGFGLGASKRSKP